MTKLAALPNVSCKLTMLGYPYPYPYTYPYPYSYPYP